MRKFCFRRQLMTVLIAGAASIPIQAATVNGSFWLGSTSFEVTPNDIIFYSIPALVPTTGLPNGNFQVLPPVSSSFTGTTGDIGTIKNLTRTAADSPPYSYAPTDTPIDVIDWMTIPAPSISFTMTTLASGETQDNNAAPICSAANWNAPGTVCVADASSPFLLTNLQNPNGSIDTHFTMTAGGVAYYTATPMETSNWVADLSGSVAGETIGTVLGRLATTGHVDTSIQGSVNVTPVPEPASAYLLMGSLVSLLGLGLRRIRRS